MSREITMATLARCASWLGSVGFTTVGAFYVNDLIGALRESISERDAAITQRDEVIAAAVRWVRNSEGDGVANDLYIHLAAHLTAGKSEKTP